MMQETHSLEAAYQYCLDYTQAHTEHFPVVSWLLPKALQRDIAVIYTFARSADTLVDENHDSAEARLQQLESHQYALLNDPPPQHSQDHPSALGFRALHDLMQRYPLLDRRLFLDLLDAFKQDILKKSYQTEIEVLDYCRRSANPVGRLLLYLSDQASPDQVRASDAICTALQLINFVNDIHSDYQERDRCYMPVEALEKWGLSAQDLYLEKPSQAVQSFIQAQLNLAESFVTQGASLGSQLPGRFGFYIEMVIQSASHMIRTLRRRTRLDERLRFRWHDWIWVFFRTVVQALKAC